MKRILVSFYLITAGLLAVGVAVAQEKTIKKVPAKPTTSINGKALFHEYCAVCHGENGKGNGPAASALKQAPGDLTMIAHNNNGTFPEERVMGVIKGTTQIAAHGNQDMPMWGAVFSNMAGNSSLGLTRVHALLQFVSEMQAK